MSGRHTVRGTGSTSVLLLTCWLLSAPAASAPDDADVAHLVADNVTAGVLSFRITDDAGAPIPCRLTFIGADGPGANLFTRTDARPTELAVRNNVIYTVSGVGRVTVPAGTYTVYASRGMEWSIQSAEIEVSPDEPATFEASLRREVDTTGWISGDFHLHTLTHSGHGDANMEERVISFVGEGLEFAVATDHNHNTDYGPAMRKVGIQNRVTTVTGNEVSTPIGHFNAFPLDPQREPPPPDTRNARSLFKLIRDETNSYGVTPVIQLNHPRWYGIDYFRRTGLDPVTGTSELPSYSSDFDSLEVFNDNPGWGYYNDDVPDGPPRGSNRHWVLGDWFNLLNRGYRYTAVGNSDSHTVYSSYCGWPRNFVASSTDDPAKIDVAEVATAIRRQRTFTSFGPFVTYTANGRPMGADVVAKDGAVTLAIRVQAASWIDVDRIKIVVNGDVRETIPVPQTRDIVRYDDEVSVNVARDCWITLLVEGDDSLAPIVHDNERPTRPLAVMNPVWVDADGDGWSSAWLQAQQTAAAMTKENWRATYDSLAPRQRGLLALAAAETSSPAAGDVIAAALGGELSTAMMAARAAEHYRRAPVLDAVRDALDRAENPYLQVALVRALADRRGTNNEQIIAFLESAPLETRERYGEELVRHLPGGFVRQWAVIGYFPNDRDGAGLRRAYGPEQGVDLTASYEGKQGKRVRWQPLTAGADGYLDLRRIDQTRSAYENAVAYAATQLRRQEACEITYAVGTDAGCRVWLNGVLVHDDPARHGATPLQHVGRLKLRSGLNTLIVKVENGRSQFGLYFRVMDNTVSESPFIRR